MLQEQDQGRSARINRLQEIQTQNNPKLDKLLKQSQLDFEKNYPKNIFIPMIEYLAEIGLKHQYEQCVGSRQEFQGKNVVSLGLVHKLMGAEWFTQNVQKRVLISNISNKILMNSKIKKKLFHLFVVKNLFQVYDEDLKQFKKRISKLTNSISEQSYIADQLFEYPSSILYLLRLFYKLISTFDINQERTSKTQFLQQNTSKMELIDRLDDQVERTSSQGSSLEQGNVDSTKNTKLGSKEEYKYYIRRIIHHFNSEIMNKEFMRRFFFVQNAIIQREKEVIQKYRLPQDVPSWGSFVQKVVQKCFQCYKRSAKITHAMMNDWINNFKECITTNKGSIKYKASKEIENKINSKKQLPYQFKPLILQYYPHSF